MLRRVQKRDANQMMKGTTTLTVHTRSITNLHQQGNKNHSKRRRKAPQHEQQSISTPCQNSRSNGYDSLHPKRTCHQKFPRQRNHHIQNGLGKPMRNESVETPIAHHPQASNWGQDCCDGTPDSPRKLWSLMRDIPNQAHQST